jgi:hypothetical protein
VRAGLDSVVSKRHAFIDLLGVHTSASGAAARVEAGLRVTPQLGVFGFGQLDKGGRTLGGGVRYTW